VVAIAYLDRCDVCGGKVSSNARACPHCGDPRVVVSSYAKPDWYFEQREKWKKEGRCSECGGYMKYGGSAYALGHTMKCKSCGKAVHNTIYESWKK